LIIHRKKARMLFIYNNKFIIFIMGCGASTTDNTAIKPLQ